MFGKRKFERELDAELRSYVELQAAEKVRRGMSPEDALGEALWRASTELVAPWASARALAWMRAEPRISR